METLMKGAGAGQRVASGGLGLVLAAPLLVGLLVALAPAALAAPRATWGVDVTWISCEGTLDGQPLTLSAAVAPEGSYAALGLYAPGADPHHDPAVLVAEQMDVTLDGSRFGATGTLVLPSDDGGMGRAAVGVGNEVTVALDLVVSGTQPARYRHRLGNHLGQYKGEVIGYDVSGSAQVAGAVAPLACDAFTERWNGMANSPNSLVLHQQSGTIECTVTDAAGRTLHVNGDGIDLAFTVLDPGGAVLLDGFYHDDHNTAFTSRSIAATLTVHDGVTGARVGEARILADVRWVGKVTRWREVFDLGQAQVSEQPLAFTGSLALPDGSSFDLASCAGSWIDVKVQVRNPASRP
jgi:hypothetical protein